MTTKQDDKANTKTDIRSLLPPPLYKIQYPNSRTGMFSLRAPFKDFDANESQLEIHEPNLTPDVAQPKYLHIDQSIFFIFYLFLNV